MNKKYAFKVDKVNILIITKDPKPYADKLYDYLCEYDDINCNKIEETEEFNEDEMGIPDFLLNTGCISDKHHIVEKIRNLYPSVFCIQIDLIDHYIKNECRNKKYHEYVDWETTNEELLQHLQEIRNQIKEGFDFYECGCSYLKYKKKDFRIIAVDNSIIRLLDLGISPAGPSFIFPDQQLTYHADFCAENNRLKLDNLNIQENSLILPVLNRISPKRDEQNRYSYDNLDMNLNYSGNFIASDLRCYLFQRPCVLDKLFGWQNMYLFTVKDGMIVSCQNINRMVRYVQHQRKIKICWQNKEYLTPTQKMIQKDLNDRQTKTPEQLYKRYAEYFDAFHRRHIK